MRSREDDTKFHSMNRSPIRAPPNSISTLDVVAWATASASALKTTICVGAIVIRRFLRNPQSPINESLRSGVLSLQSLERLVQASSPNRLVAGFDPVSCANAKNIESRKGDGHTKCQVWCIG
jgi:hypothetical protein